jgi:hypothetical protein
MEETRKLDLRPLLAVVAIGLVVLTMWAAGAFAAGGTSSSDNSTRGSEGTPYSQAQDEDQSPSREDCPEKDGGRNGPGSGGPGSSGL